MPISVILLSVTVAGFWDLRWRRIPNWLVALTIVVSLTWHAVVNGVPGLWMSLLGLLVGTAILFPFFLVRGMGAGDVKLFGAIGAAVTYNHILTVFVISAIIAAAMALGRALWARALMSTFRNVVALTGGFIHGRFGAHPVLNIANERALAIPFGVSVAIATWLFVLFGK